MSDHLLSPIITAHCFWSPRCKHTISDRPDAAHAAMEAHYAAAHGRDMDRALGGHRTVAQPRGCLACRRGDHDLCTGLDGPMTTHPDSLPRCGCTCHERTAR